MAIGAVLGVGLILMARRLRVEVNLNMQISCYLVLMAILFGEYPLQHVLA
jgi:hypothetical protein